MVWIDNSQGIDWISNTDETTDELIPSAILVIGDRGSGKCCDKNALVTMADGTHKRLCEVKVGEKVISYLNSGEAIIKEVIASHSMGFKPAYRIKLRGGFNIVTSEDHKFIKVTKLKQIYSKKPFPERKWGKRTSYIENYEWTPLKDIKYNDKVAIPKQYPRTTYDIYDEKIYELIGYLLGDGGITNEVMMSCENPLVVERLKTLLPSRMMLQQRGKYDYAIKSIHLMTTGHGIDIPRRFTPMKEILKDLQLMHTNSYTKFIPEELLMASDKNLYALLSGLIVTDGCIERNKGITYTTVSKRLSEDISLLLKNLGLTHNINPRKINYKNELHIGYVLSINRREDLIKIYENCEILHKKEKLTKLISTKREFPTHTGVNRKFYYKDMEFCRVNEIEQVEDIEMWDISVIDGQSYIANNIIVHNSMSCEELKHYYYRNGYTIIVLGDAKDDLEAGFSMFEVEKDYHKRLLRRTGAPMMKIPTKIHHPLTLNLDASKMYPEIDWFSISIKSLNRIDIGYLAETEKNTTSLQIILETINNLKNNEGLHHLVFNAENKTENQANLEKKGIRLRSDNPEDFYSKSKIGTEKTAGEVNKYFQPFITDYSITPANYEKNLNITKIMNDQKHYHIFTYKYIKDKRLKSFYMIHLLQEILTHKDEMKYKIMIHIPELRYMLPRKSDGFSTFLAQAVSDMIATMRSNGLGFLGDTQTYSDTNPIVTGVMNEHYIGKMSSLNEYKYIGDALKLGKTEIEKMKGLRIGEWLGKVTNKNTGDSKLEKMNFYLPPHSHKEVFEKFEDKYAQKYPEKMQDIIPLITDLNKLKIKIEQEVAELAGIENKNKREIIKKQQKEKQKRKEEKPDTKTEEQLEKKKGQDKNIWNEWKKEYETGFEGETQSYKKIADRWTVKLGYKITSKSVERKIKSIADKTIDEEEVIPPSEE